MTVIFCASCATPMARPGSIDTAYRNRRLLQAVPCRRSVTVELTDCLTLAHELGAQDELFDGIMPAVDFLPVLGEPDRADDSALLQGLVGALDLQVLDQHDGVPVGKQIAGGVTHFGALCLLCGNLGGRSPFSQNLVVDVIVVILVAYRLFPFAETGSGL